MIFATGWQATSVCEPKKIKRGRYPAFFSSCTKPTKRERERVHRGSTKDDSKASARSGRTNLVENYDNCQTQIIFILK